MQILSILLHVSLPPRPLLFIARLKRVSPKCNSSTPVYFNAYSRVLWRGRSLDFNSSSRFLWKCQSFRSEWYVYKRAISKIFFISRLNERFLLLLLLLLLPSSFRHFIISTEENSEIDIGDRLFPSLPCFHVPRAIYIFIRIRIFQLSEFLCKVFSTNTLMMCSPVLEPVSPGLRDFRRLLPLRPQRTIIDSPGCYLERAFPSWWHIWYASRKLPVARIITCDFDRWPWKINKIDERKKLILSFNIAVKFNFWISSLIILIHWNRGQIEVLEMKGAITRCENIDRAMILSGLRLFLDHFRFHGEVNFRERERGGREGGRGELDQLVLRYA